MPAGACLANSPLRQGSGTHPALDRNPPGAGSELTCTGARMPDGAGHANRCTEIGVRRRSGTSGG